MRSAYKEPVTPARLVTAKEQFMHPATQPSRPPDVEPSFPKLEPLDTTHEGFEKYLDPYLTTSRFHHRPYTADQMSRESNSPAKNIVTYYTSSDTPMVRTPKTKPEFWRLPLQKPKFMYDREVFSEIRTHTRSDWVPGSFRTEVRDNYTSYMAKPEYRIQNPEEEVQSFYQRRLANLPPNISEEYASLLRGYSTSNSVVGSEKPLCAKLDPYPKKNKKLEIRENKIIEKYRNRT